MSSCPRVEDTFVLENIPGNEFVCPIDGTEAGFFILEPTSANPPVIQNDFIIWLGDSDLCPDEEACDNFCETNTCPTGFLSNPDFLSLEDLKNCFYRQLSCSSSRWQEETVCATSILQELDTFTRVFIPQCTFDMFLGKETGNNSPFKGSIFFDSVIDRLIDRNLGLGKVILGGSRHSGIGVLNLMKSLSDKLQQVRGTEVDIKAIVDSAWLIKSFDFSVTRTDNDFSFASLERLQANVGSYIERAVLDEDCRATFLGSNQLLNCLIPSELIEFSPFLQGKDILFIQSQYDTAFLNEYKLLEQQVEDEFNDPQTLATNGIKFIEQIGATVRGTIIDASIRNRGQSINHLFFSTSCGDHASVVPINTLEISPRTADFGAAGNVVVSRSGDTWNNLKVNNQTLRNTVLSFVEGSSSLDQTQLDSCGSFLCGDTCQIESPVVPFLVSINTDSFTQDMILLLAIVMIGLGWLAFCVTYIRVLIFRWSTKKEWAKVRKGLELEADPKMSMLHVNQLLSDTANESFIEEFGDRTSFVSLMVTRMSYIAPPKRAGKEPYTILKDVTVCAKAGEVHALMGPSGSGKSTLLDVLSFTRTSGTMRGTHYINGVPSHLKRMVFLKEWLTHHLSYVRQQDVLFPRLTVRQHLTHAAWLMLPESMKASEKIDRVYKVAKLLGLDHVLDTRIGDGGVRIEGGLSGGERRRVSVATQLLKLPGAIVLDEPTSGLDSTNALLLVSLLHRLAHDANVCVMLTIHQPRREIFQLFDRLTILFDGRITFSGTPEDAGKFFRFRLDQVNIGDDILDKLEDYRKNARQLEAIEQTYRNGHLGKRVKARVAVEETYLTKPKAQELRKRLKYNAKKDGRVSWEKATSMWQTTKVLLSRTILRGGFDIERTTFISVVGAVLVGTVFLENDSYTKSAALAYLIVATMTILQATFLGTRYQLEKGMWSHEKDAGTKVSWKAFLLSLFMRNIVTSTVEGLAFAVPVYFMGNLNREDPERFPLFLILLVMVAITVISQNTLVEIDRVRRGGVSGPDLRQAALINMSLLALGVLFNGFIIPLDTIPPLLQWVPYTMLTFWGFVGILVNNFRGFEFPCNLSVLECATRTGDSFIVEFSYDAIDVYQAILALCGLTLLYHILSVLDFFLRFVADRGEMKREEVEGDQRTYTPAELEHGFAGDTMKLLIRNNQPKAKKKRPKKKRSIQTRRVGNSKDYRAKSKSHVYKNTTIKEVVDEPETDNFFSHPESFEVDI